jgi:hypothetical protein
MEGLPEKKEKQMRRTIILLTTMAMTILMATSVALAVTVNCPSSGLCKGTNEADVLLGGSGDNSISGYDGDDYMTGGPAIADNTTGADRMYGGNGKDQMWGGAGDDTMLGGDGDDDISGGLMSDNGHDYDRLYGDWGRDGLDGGRYNDFYDGGPGSDRMIDSSKVSNDTYIGLFPIWWGFGDVGGYNNSVFDQGGNGDILDLSYFDRSQVLISWGDNADADANRDSLRVLQKGTKDSVNLRYYFDNKGGTGRGVGAIEKIKFKGGITVGFPAPQG